jgi:beta-carotene hydroxylase
MSFVPLLRRSADWRTLLWAFIFFPALPALVYAGQISLGAAVPAALYLSFCAGVLTHNQNHCPTFRSRGANALYSVWLSAFYGFPIWAWIPTHNQNHHRYLNGPGDATSTERSGRKDSLFQALIYPLRSSSWQFPAVREYALAQLRHGGSRARLAMAQVAIVPLAHSLIAWAFIAKYGWPNGLLLSFVAHLGPALISTWFMMFINYAQHIGCDPQSPDAHSRDFVGVWENWFVFNAGYHTAHHENPGLHWSELPHAHAARQAALNPDLSERNLVTYLWGRYGLFARTQRA